MQKSSCVRKLLDQGNAKQKTSCINTTNREITPLPLPLKMISSGIILRMHAISKARMHPQTIHCGDELQFRANSVFHQLLRRTVLMPNAFSYRIAYKCKNAGLLYFVHNTKNHSGKTEKSNVADTFRSTETNNCI